MDTSARGVAMGGAMTAVTNDSSSIYWNPAGLAHVPRLSTSFMHAQYVADITYEAASYAQRVDDASVIGAGVRYLNGGSIPQTTSTPSERDVHPVLLRRRGRLGPVDLRPLRQRDGRLDGRDRARDPHRAWAWRSANGYGADFGIQSRFYALRDDTTTSAWRSRTSARARSSTRSATPCPRASASAAR